MIKGEVPKLKVALFLFWNVSVKINQIFKILIGRHSYYDEFCLLTFDSEKKWLLILTG